MTADVIFMANVKDIQEVQVVQSGLNRLHKGSVIWPMKSNPNKLKVLKIVEGRGCIRRNRIYSLRGIRENLHAKRIWV